MISSDHDTCPVCGMKHTSGGLPDLPDVWLCRNGECSRMLVTDPRLPGRPTRLATDEETAWERADSRWRLGLVPDDQRLQRPASLT